MGHAQRVPQPLRGPSLFSGIVGHLRRPGASPRRAEPFRRCILEPGHTATPSIES
ncbi:hypothetical protein [Streptomyces erythrochromogenes]|uniref:hypothetical protein n=1 Tax=Streptomyces erythrochromogenes TaxID=285574 RepID=UPI003814A78E